jgi:hypothetical protein
MTSLGMIPSPSAQSHFERVLSRRAVSLIGDLEAGHPKEVFEVPHPSWMQQYSKPNEELAKIKHKAVSP